MFVIAELVAFALDCVVSRTRIQLFPRDVIVTSVLNWCYRGIGMEGETDRETDRQTDRERQREAQRQRGRIRETERER